MKPKERDELATEVRGKILRANVLAEIPEKRRTARENSELEDLTSYMTEHADKFVEALLEPILEEINFVEEGEEECVARWQSVLLNNQPPHIGVGMTLSGDDLAQKFQELYSRQVTVFGCYEESISMQEAWDSALDKAALVLRALWGFDKIDKAKCLFEALIPAEIQTKRRRLVEYTERFKRRTQIFEHAFNALVQMKLVNFGTPTNPHRIMEQPSAPGPTERPSQFRRGTGISPYPTVKR